MASGEGDHPVPGNGASQYSTSVRQLTELVLDRPPSCIEFIPKAGSLFGDLFVVGTYELESDDANVEQPESCDEADSPKTRDLTPKTQSRKGTLTLLEVLPSTKTLKVLHKIECESAIYDLHFLPGKEFFAVVSSTGTISFYCIKEKTYACPTTREDVHEIVMQPIFTAEVFSQTTIITFFQFIPAQLPKHGPLISATTNDGGVYLMEYSLEEGDVRLLNDGAPISKHKLKFMNMADYAWCCAGSAKNSLTIYSGGDGGDLIEDSISFGLKEPHSYDSSRKRSQNHAFHDAGVTAILPLTTDSLADEELLLTGSYDEFVRIYSTEQKKVLAKLKLDGGVYRLKNLGQVNWLSPQSTTYAILACCMRVGTKILHVKGSSTGTWSIEVVAALDVPSNDTYCYAAAVRHSRPLESTPPFEEKRLCVSGTFVDKKLVVWEFIHEFKRPEDDVAGESKPTGFHVPNPDLPNGVPITSKTCEDKSK